MSQKVTTETKDENERHDRAKNDASYGAVRTTGIADVKHTTTDARKFNGVVSMKAIRQRFPERQVSRSRGENLQGTDTGSADGLDFTEMRR